MSGEHFSSGSWLRWLMGSSPRERGAPLGSWTLPPVFWDHPRVSGEHRQFSWVLDFESGSSPRERGAQPPALI